MTEPDGGLLRRSTRADADAGGTWVGDSIVEAARRVDALTREIAALERGLQAQRDELAQLADQVQMVDGRTLRQEHGQEAARQVREELSQLHEQLEAEAALRRDLQTTVSRQREHERELQHELQRALETIAARLDDFAGREASTGERHVALVEELAEQARDEGDVATRLEALEQHLAALQDADRHAGAEVARLAAAVTPLLGTIDGIEARTRAIQADQRRIDDEVAALRAVRDREDALLEVIEQQRATRARLEDRVSRVEEALEELRQSQGDEDETLSLLRRQLAGEAEQRRVLAERLEAQRDALIEHLRRQMRAGEEHGRREIEEIERGIRIQRELTNRLEEQSEATGQEQPL